MRAFKRRTRSAFVLAVTLTLLAAAQLPTPAQNADTREPVGCSCGGGCQCPAHLTKPQAEESNPKEPALRGFVCGFDGKPLARSG